MPEVFDIFTLPGRRGTWLACGCLKDGKIAKSPIYLRAKKSGGRQEKKVNLPFVFLSVEEQHSLHVCFLEMAKQRIHLLTVSTVTKTDS